MTLDLSGLSWDITPFFIKNSGYIFSITIILILFKIGKFIRVEYKDKRLSEINNCVNTIREHTTKILNYIDKKDVDS
jgi:hypothetical protein